jgi:branched-subunit amino acid ABC-type transport system permease component
MNVDEALQYIAQGILLGAAYGLVALPISVVYATIRSIDASVGSQAVVAATTAAAVGGALGIVVGVVAGIGTSAVVGVIYLLLRSRRNVDPITIVLATFGVAFALQSLVLLYHGRDAVIEHAFTHNANLGFLSLSPMGLLNLAIGLVVMAALWLMLHHTPIGRALRATADNPGGAEIAGLHVGAMQFAALLLGGALASGAGILLLYTTGVSYLSGLDITLTAIGAAVLFGFRGPVYGFAGGILFGIVESLVTGYTSSGLAAAVPLLFIFVVLASGRSVIEVNRP